MLYIISQRKWTYVQKEIRRTIFPGAKTRVEAYSEEISKCSLRLLLWNHLDINPTVTKQSTNIHKCKFLNPQQSNIYKNLIFAKNIVYKKQMQKGFVTAPVGEHAPQVTKEIILIGQAVLEKSTNIYEIYE